MPAYNASNYIQEAIDSVKAQTFSNWELIIIDDGSTDSTSVIIKKNIQKDYRIKILYQENGKQGKARNLGISNATGKFIAFLDADDVWMSEKLEVQLKEIKLKNVDLVFSDCYVFTDIENYKTNKKMSTLNRYFNGIDDIHLFLEINRIPILTVLVKREKIKLVNGFSEIVSIQNAEDYHLWLKMLISDFVFYGSDKILAAYRVHVNSATDQDKFARKQKLEVFFDLGKNNPAYSEIFLRALKKELRMQYHIREMTKNEVNSKIDENCRYLNKIHYSFFFKCLNVLLGFKLMRKIINNSLND